MKEVVIRADQLNEDGSFKCPNCGNLIRPDVEYGYTILKGEYTGNLFELFIKCDCGQVIILRWSEEHA